jgi:hypothetical protein
MSRRLFNLREHRRGLVLGLTLAEVLLLLLFLTLLGLSMRLNSLQAKLHSFEPLEKQLTKEGDLTPEDLKLLITKLSSLQRLESEIANLKMENSELRAKALLETALGLDHEQLQAIGSVVHAARSIDPTDPPAALKRALELYQEAGPNANADQLKVLSDMIAEGDYTNNLDRMRELAVVHHGAAKIDPNNPPAVLKRALAVLEKLGTDTEAKDVKALSEMISERDQLRQQRDNLMRSGNGLTYPSCWTTADGRTQYIFDITIRDAGLVVRDAAPADRKQDSAWQYVGSFQRGIEIRGESFAAATKRLLEWSKANNCRFYSGIRDGTGETSKSAYKHFRGLIENNFYILLLALNAPPLEGRAPQTSAEKKDDVQLIPELSMPPAPRNATPLPWPFDPAPDRR